MKTTKLIALLGCAILAVSCQKSDGPEKSGEDYPRTYLYAGLEQHESKYYRWEGGTNFTELPGISFPEYYDDAEIETAIIDYYDLFFPFLEFTFESDSLMRVVSRAVDGFPALDTITPYINNEIYYVFGEAGPGIPYAWYPDKDGSTIENRGFAYNFNYYDNFQAQREYFALTITEAARLEKTEQELLEEIVSTHDQWIQPADTIQLKLFEVVFDLE
ncbi:hypothetical protein [Flavilitoribacter nigricans]|uniref:Uncharacterized protein n=1 Tax=Flavilitoribacter nigricans (strain ATCC 23147 / DSM 23189 / NBRC 102662 / NCIMB 1420 / SS-2) TaxID=1122177 RepID=A0A2D0MYQ8_FLAN2|nr:hypothetical protein [Flavilitoribacter nigricans]PHN01385.1 hypothetical protein CRP01_37610 [Flavilitoribacter nigricans DSM 23189 = NBRC 102662]